MKKIIFIQELRYNTDCSGNDKMYFRGRWVFVVLEIDYDPTIILYPNSHVVINSNVYPILRAISDIDNEVIYVMVGSKSPILTGC